LQAKNADETPMSIEEVKTECFVLMVAASDTTSAFICPFVNNIIQSPRVCAKLMQEIEAFEKAGRLTSPIVTFDETNEMPYFMACVKETLRFSPSTPMIMPRYISKGGLNLFGKFAPEGTEIGANPYVVHRNKAVFGDNADEFWPERWLDDPEKAKEMDRYNFAFGYGTRVCLGKNIAQLETQKLCLQVSITPIFAS
jgi:cytochrome P450